MKKKVEINSLEWRLDNLEKSVSVLHINRKYYNTRHEAQVDILKEVLLKAIDKLAERLDRS